MQFSTPLLRCAFLKREKRFFIHATHPQTQAAIVAHCPNTGSMKGIIDAPPAAVWLTHHGDASPRALKYTLELAELPDGTLVGTHTGRANALAVEALQAGLLPQFTGWHIKTEAKFDAATRFDLLLTHPATGQTCWGEVKNVTLRQGANAAFPDSVTTRGTKHLLHLTALARQGLPALQVFIVQRNDCQAFTPAADLDPAYAAALQALHAAGGTVAALACRVTPQGVAVAEPLPILL